MNFQEVIAYFEEISDENVVNSNKRFAIGCEYSYGIRLPVIRKLAKEIGKDHDLAIELWNHPYHESHLLATMIEEKEKVTSKQLNEWVNSFYSWDIVDQACLNLLVDLQEARDNIFIWCESEKEFVKRTAFSLIAVIAVRDKNAESAYFDKYFPLIKKAAFDNRNFVKKSVNWALRQIGKRDIECNRKALDVAYEISEIDDKTCRWISSNAIKELESEKVQKKLS
ncbi:DNA alkylation repair protein [Methanobrevibacter sp.]|uniref:DNA alkylation repair protein n=1 Tax=Methanobrevibacter sp. TaxID=66852 RepID=UPI00388E13B0